MMMILPSTTSLYIFLRKKKRFNEILREPYRCIHTSIYCLKHTRRKMFSREIASVLLFFSFLFRKSSAHKRREHHLSLGFDAQAGSKGDMKTLKTKSNKTAIMKWKRSISKCCDLWKYFFFSLWSRYPSPRCLALMIISSRKMNFIRPPMAKKREGKAIFLFS